LFKSKLILFCFSWSYSESQQLWV